MTTRNAILEGAAAAARTHQRLGTRAAFDAHGGSIDVFGALLSLNVWLVFRPLEGLLGACLPGPTPGVIISTQRPLRIQRFTAAHELGHIELGHEMSLDGEEILTRASLHNEMELAAEIFAGAFLLPKWLLQHHGRVQKWNRDSMANPHVVYQLALRAGASYEATCFALERNDIIDARTRRSLTAKPRREIKQELLQGFEIESYHSDVWLLTECDEGVTIEGQPNDLFIFRLSEKGGAGYLWTTSGLVDAGFAILSDQREIPPPTEAIGGPVTRALTARPKEPSAGGFALELKRPWEKAGPSIASLRVTYDLFGKEIGMPRAIRRTLVRAA